MDEVKPEGSAIPGKAGLRIFLITPLTFGFLGPWEEGRGRV